MVGLFHPRAGLAQLGERQTEDLKVVCSIHTSRNLYFCSWRSFFLGADASFFAVNFDAGAPFRPSSPACLKGAKLHPQWPAAMVSNFIYTSRLVLVTYLQKDHNFVTERSYIVPSLLKRRWLFSIVMINSQVRKWP